MDTINNDTKMEETVKGSHKWEPPFRAIGDLWSNDKTVEQLHSQTLKCSLTNVIPLHISIVDLARSPAHSPITTVLFERILYFTFTLQFVLSFCTSLGI